MLYLIHGTTTSSRCVSRATKCGPRSRGFFSLPATHEAGRCLSLLFLFLPRDKKSHQTNTFALSSLRGTDTTHTRTHARCKKTLSMSLVVSAAAASAASSPLRSSSSGRRPLLRRRSWQPVAARSSSAEGEDTKKKAEPAKKEKEKEKEGEKLTPEARDLWATIESHRATGHPALLVAQTAPAVRVALSEEFGEEPGAFSPGQMVAALRALGLDRVAGSTLVHHPLCFVGLRLYTKTQKGAHDKKAARKIIFKKTWRW